MIDNIAYELEYAEFTFHLDTDLEIIGCEWTEIGGRIDPEEALEFAGIRHDDVTERCHEQIADRNTEVRWMAKGYDL